MARGKGAKKGGDYALYNGDELIVWGTLKEIAAFTGLKYKTIIDYHAPSKIARSGGNGHILIRIEDEEENEK